MSTQLEHANLTVNNIDTMVEFLTTAFDDFAVRHDAVAEDGRRWVHVGNANTYIALNAVRDGREIKFAPYSGQRGCNHLGYVVDDAQAVAKRLRTAGYHDSTYPNAHPHRTRVYFNDPDGNDWEFVQYHSNRSAERNDYHLADAAVPSATGQPET